MHVWRDAWCGNVHPMLRKMLWTTLYGVLGAAATMVARRLATRVWRIAPGETPPAKR